MSKRILIVDDEKNVRLSFRMALETEGYQIFEASSAGPALELLADKGFALVILDLRMPGTDGLDLLEKLLENGIRIPVMMVSAHGEIRQAVKALKLGAVDFLEKPICPPELRQMVAKVIEQEAREDKFPSSVFAAHIAAAKRCLNVSALAKAKLHLAKALELNQESVEALNLAGVLAEIMEDYKQAKRYYGQAIRIDSNYEPAQQNMRRLYEVDQFGSSRQLVNLGDD